MTPEIKGELVVDLMRSAQIFAYQLREQVEQTYLEQVDLVQIGMIGFLDAIQKYDPTRGAQLSTYAKIRMRFAMLEELEVLRRKKRVPAGGMVDLDEVADAVVEDGRNWCDAMHKRELLDLISRNLHKLAPVHREAIEGIYFNGHTAAEVARSLGITQGAVSLRHKRGLRKLQKIFNTRLINQRR